MSSLVLAVRVQAIPLIVQTLVHATTADQERPEVRDKLLDLLFTLHKRPDEETRKKSCKMLLFSFFSSAKEVIAERPKMSAIGHL